MLEGAGVVALGGLVGFLLVLPLPASRIAVPRDHSDACRDGVLDWTPGCARCEALYRQRFGTPAETERS